MIFDLPRPFPSRYGAPVLNRVDTGIFQERYFAACMECGFCFDSCCQYGADMDEGNASRLRAVAPALSSYTGIPAESFLKDWVESDDDYPGGRYTRTEVADGACIFLNRPDRGCRIHSFCLDQGLDYHELKPMVCSLFPLSFCDGLLRPSIEVRERELVCRDQGVPLYDGVREELRYYFGDEMISVLDGLRPSPSRMTSAP